MQTTKIVVTVLSACLLLLWMALAVWPPRNIERAQKIAVLRYGSVLRIFALILTLSPLALLIYGVWTYHWRSDLLAGMTFLTASLIAGLLLIEVERVQIVLREDAITRYSPWVGVATIAWNEIEQIDYSHLNRWFLVHGDGRTIRVSRHLVGVAAFAQSVKKQVPPERWLAAARALDAAV